VVIDTNVYGSNGEFRARSFAADARLCEANEVDVWVPEVVVWEWAEHAHTRAVTAHTASTRAWSILKDANVRGLEWVVPNVDQLIDGIRSAIEAHPNAHIVDCEPDNALLALRDQVLQQGAGSKKEGIKTGAADSAWLRDVASQNGGDLDGLLILTGDRSAVEGVCAKEAWSTPQIASSLRLVAADFAWVKVPSASELATLNANLTASLPWPAAFDDSAAVEVDLTAVDVSTVPIEITDEDDFFLYRDIRTEVTLSQVYEILTVSEPQISTDGHLFTARIDGVAEVWAQEPTMDRDGVLAWTTVDHEAEVSFDVAVRLGADGRIVSITGS